MTVVASGWLSESLVAAKALLVSLAAWQTLCGGASGAAAKTHIAEMDQEALDKAAREAMRPLAVISLGDSEVLERSAHPNTWEQTQTFVVEFRMLPAPLAVGRSEQYLYFTNAIGGVIDELRTASGIGGLNVSQIQRTVAPQRLEAADIAAGEVDEFVIEYELTATSG